MLRLAGFHGTPVRGLAEEAGVSLPTLDYHFGSKLLLLEEVVLTTLERCEARLAAAAEHGGSPRGAITAIVRTGVDFHCDHAEQVAVAYAEVRNLDGRARRPSTSGPGRVGDQDRRALPALVLAMLGSSPEDG